MPLIAPQPKRILSVLDAECECRHGAIAYTCGYAACNPGGPLDALTRNGKTIKQAIEEFIADGRIGRVEIDQHIRGVLRWRKVTNIAKVAGMVVGCTIVVVGGTTVLRLIRRKDEPAGEAK